MDMLVLRQLDGDRSSYPSRASGDQSNLRIAHLVGSVAAGQD